MPEQLPEVELSEREVNALIGLALDNEDLTRVDELAGLLLGANDPPGGTP